MYKKIKPSKTDIKINTSYEGERIEQKIERITVNKEPINDGAPIIYTERKDGVQPEYDIRTDRWEIALDAMDKVTASHIAKREERLKAIKGGQNDENNGKNETGGQSIDATS